MIDEDSAFGPGMMFGLPGPGPKKDTKGIPSDPKKEKGKEIGRTKMKKFKQFVEEDLDIHEASTSWKKMMNGVRSGESGPWSLIAIENRKVVGQKIDIKIKEMIPANYEAFKKEHPKAKIHIEDAGGHVVWNESISLDFFLDSIILEDELNELALTSTGVKGLLQAIYYNWDQIKDRIKQKYYMSSFRDVIAFIKSGDQEEQKELEVIVKDLGIEILDLDDKRTWDIR